MSELQTGLLVISAVIVVAVLIYNKVEQIRSRRSTETAFASTHEDVLLPTQPVALNIDTSIDAPAAVFAADDPRIEHTLGLSEDPVGAEPVTQTPVSPQSTPAAREAQALQSAVLDPHIDFIAMLDLPRAYSGSEIALHAESLENANLRKPVFWEGYDTGLQSWQPLHPQHAYRQLRVGLQLVNRSGPTDGDELAVFLLAVQDMAEALGARMDVGEVQAAKHAALVLDAFCADHDIQIGLSVLGREGQTLMGTKIRALAESNGCVLARDGRFYKLNEQGAMLYALGNTEPMPFHPETLKTLNTRGIALTLDVPRAPGTPATFRAYIEFARQLTQALGGVLVDDERKAISDASLEQISVQLNALHQAMAARGIPAGGATALRLFA